VSGSCSSGAVFVHVGHQRQTDRLGSAAGGRRHGIGSRRSTTAEAAAQRLGGRRERALATPRKRLEESRAKLRTHCAVDEKVGRIA